MTYILKRCLWLGRKGFGRARIDVRAIVSVGVEMMGLRLLR